VSWHRKTIKPAERRARFSEHGFSADKPRVFSTTEVMKKIEESQPFHRQHTCRTLAAKNISPTMRVAATMQNGLER
jgi:hypothetical protein